ncbi:MAG: TetR family transcriptional regulator C-terminal domain-containing protein, partial [Candidatus Dormibacteraeota bacterium]|nr:TetR family transcriptional regulator C-terminal domain-containing protein [Candidatus Dormibacteraeota bacterium]
AYYRFVGEHSDAFRVLFRELGDPGGRLTQPRRRLQRRVAAAIHDILDEQGSSPDQREEGEALAEAYLGAARGLADWWLHQSDWSAEDVADRLWKLIMGGLRDLGPPQD